MGAYVPGALTMDPGEKTVAMLCLNNYDGDIVLFFANGKGVRIPLDSYKTVNNRRKLVKAFYADSPLIALFKIGECGEYLLRTDNCRALLVNVEQIVRKTTRTSSGSQLITLKRERQLFLSSRIIRRLSRCRKKANTASPCFLLQVRCSRISIRRYFSRRL